MSPRRVIGVLNILLKARAACRWRFVVIVSSLRFSMPIGRIIEACACEPFLHLPDTTISNQCRQSRNREEGKGRQHAVLTFCRRSAVGTTRRLCMPTEKKLCAIRPLCAMGGSFDCVCILREIEINKTTAPHKSITHTFQLLNLALMGRISKSKCMVYGCGCCCVISGPWVSWGVRSIVYAS